MQKVFIGTGKVAHYIEPGAPRLPGENEARRRALCNTAPLWPGFWLGLNGDAPHAEELPICRVCESRMEALLHARSA